MSLLLNIDTAFETACVCISRSAEIITLEKNHNQKNHASFLQPAIKQACSTAGIQLSDIDAVAIANGPGSYTGLRVGLASAKAICYALHKPLILLNTLDILAYALKENTLHTEPDILFCPLIDARRMEVYTALYDVHLNLVKEHAAVIVNDHFLEEEKENYRIVAGGNGSFKLQSLPARENIICVPAEAEMTYFVKLAHRAFGSNTFSDIAYSEPVYLKPVYLKQA